MKKLFPAMLAAVSLACAGAVYANDEPMGHEGPPHFEKALSKLPADKAKIFRATMQQVQEKNEPLMEQMHSLHDELHTIVTAPEFDKDAFLVKHREIEKLEEKIHANMTEGMASVFSQLSAEQRKTIAAAMHHKRHGHGPNGHHKGKEDKEHQEQGSDADTDSSASH